MPTRLRAFVVGACYLDVILHVDAYPKEDSKVRAQRVEKRRGGNGGNLLTVLSQFRQAELLKRSKKSSSSFPSSSTSQNLPEIQSASSSQPLDLTTGSSPPAISTTPSHVPDVACEMVCVFAGDPPQNESPSDSLIVQDLESRQGISLRHCIFRGPGYSEPTAWIISTPVSRTVVNHTTVPEMTFSEFESAVVSSSEEGSSPLLKVLEDGVEDVWFHFEGRNVPEVIRMVETLTDLRQRFGRVAVDGWGQRRRGSISSVASKPPEAESSVPTPSSVSSSSFLHILPPDIVSLSPGLSRKLSTGSTNGHQYSIPSLPTIPATPTSSTTPSPFPSTATAYLSSGTPNMLPRFTLSVEFEKTNRPGLDDLLPLADVLFFSKVYAEGMGFPGAPTGFLDNVRRMCKPGAILFVTWSEHGAFGLVNDPTRPARTFHVPAPSIVAVVDTIGAGDTFAAGCIYALGAGSCSAEIAAGWACRLATNKCAQVGFEGLAE
ncbi:hypothetical protein HDU67_008040, partial [Dinochytrium kinnereticum]